MLKNRKNIVTFSLTTLACGAVLFATGCSTLQTKTQSIVSTASTTLETANAAGAEKYAPETMKSANQYMDKAKAALGENRFIDAQKYAEKATVDSELAGVQAIKNERSSEISSLREKIAKLMP
ncbi:hypothetical protein MNBD_GAMMA16-1613 [hydrothermal vent metagenome]|uniref:DUF4398 domain-containing protein n=1 Tax=hydrothermal vent metagenome TaxID=652676 RepID=A0A3B0YYK5_9ZZZZ